MLRIGILQRSDFGERQEEFYSGANKTSANFYKVDNFPEDKKYPYNQRRILQHSLSFTFF
jgi:hypothetical protein